MHLFWLVTADRLGSMLRVVFALCFFRTVAPHRQCHCAIALLMKLYCTSLWGIYLTIKIEMQHYIKLTELEKNRKLNDLLDALDFNQVVIFVKSVSRAAELNKLLVECNFPSICIHSGMSQEERYVYPSSDIISNTA
jgi:hypothetical protein